MVGLSDNAAQLRRMREIELKHSRIAMMAVVVWPLIELSQPTDNSICLYTSATSCVDSEMTIASGAFLKSFSTGLFFVFSSALEYLAFLNRRSLTKKYIEVCLVLLSLQIHFHSPSLIIIFPLVIHY